jgi:hypothetical protein
MPGCSDLLRRSSARPASNPADRNTASKMIEPTENDIGRAVVYTGNRYPGGKLEEGVITSFNDYRVFVRYGADFHSKATSRPDLDWVRPNTSGG